MIDYKQLGKNPIQYLLGICIVVIGYLYVDVKDTMQTQIDDLKADVVRLQDENKELTYKYVELAKSINNPR